MEVFIRENDSLNSIFKRVILLLRVIKSRIERIFELFILSLLWEHLYIRLGYFLICYFGKIEKTLD